MNRVKIDQQSTGIKRPLRSWTAAIITMGLVLVGLATALVVNQGKGSQMQIADMNCTEGYVPGEVIMTVTGSADESKIRENVLSIGGTKLTMTSSAANYRTYLVTVPEGREKQVAEQLRSQPDVVAADTNGYVCAQQVTA